MERVIMTGADGFVGSHAARCFAENRVSVLALDRMERPERVEEGEYLSYRRADITDPDGLRHILPAGRYDTFVHFAWAGSAGDARSDCRLQMENALHTVACLRFAREIGCTRFVGAGSIMETEAEAIVQAQGSRPGPGYIYGMGKQAAHGLCKAVAADMGIDLIWPMITNAYGEGERSPRFVNATLRRILAGERLAFTAATQNYDFVHVSDVARAFYRIARYGKPFCQYVIGSGRARPLREFILEMVEAVAPEAVPVFGDVPYTGVEMPLSAFDTGRTEADCGFRAEVSFAEGTRRTMAWLKENP